MLNLKSIIIGLYTFILAALMVVGVIVDPTGRLYIWTARYCWGRVLLKIGGVKLTVKVADGVDWKRNYVVCSNHASQMDIPATFASLKMPVRFMAKKSLFYIPIFGWSMWLARFIPVDRGSKRKARDSINSAAEKVKKGPSVLVFPEGTRSPDGKIHSFKAGAFILAIKAGVPVLPVAIRGSYDVLPKDSLGVNSGKIEYIVGNPIETADMSLSDREGLKNKTRSAIFEMFETGVPV